MNQTFKTEADVMRQAAQHVDDTNDNVQAELNRLERTVEGLRSNWEGNAQVAFNNLMLRYNDNERKLKEALTSISDNIRDNARNFENVEAENEDIFKNVGTEGLAL
ncbi:WXG100 family type VII secretion target [Corynebacterium incognita]|uniref:ESAT-6-like protein n=1 Tax=Corynebacterium incognita TaxID=2754725 RepID=A0A7G7CMY9_9CORY|nr:WXG100 family type VII secretion target [Corynebacterium incognita]QNE88955.1 WXG100 family type VII secretion target [Corynebacterium incognita]